MLVEENTKLSIYEYFKKYHHAKKPIRAAGVISNKQNIFYTQFKPEMDDSFIEHYRVVAMISDIIHPNKQDLNYDTDAHLFSTGIDLNISLPENGKISFIMADYLIDVINQVERYNREALPLDYIPIHMSCFNTKYEKTEFGPYDYTSMRNAIYDLASYDILMEDEKIIGQELDSEKIIHDLLLQFDPSKINNTQELISYGKALSSYYQDNYFQKYIISLFPNVKNILEYISIIQNYDTDIHLTNIQTLEIELKNIASSLLENTDLEEKQLASTDVKR